MSIREEYLYLTNSGKDNKEAIERLAEIIALLRHECPWDKVQTHETLRKGMIEEAYEVVEAINNKDMANLREELGDVLLQVVFHADLAKEEGEFDLKDIINEECAGNIIPVKADICGFFLNLECSHQCRQGFRHSLESRST